MSSRRARASLALLADPAYAALKALVVERTGHHYYTDKDDQLVERIAQRIAANGIVLAADYIDRLRDPEFGDREWRQLESELTIKETFFFRFGEQFAALRTTILPKLIASRASRRRLRIWSAGCSTGAEPYSIAIVLSDLFGAALGEWQVSILGTDIDERALAAAREATYGSWSLRTMAAPERDRLFLTEGSRWRLRPAYRGMVRFERHNILDLDGPAAPLQLCDYDLILCRNMLIYFHADQASRLVEALGDRLATDGWLLLGHAEAGLATGTRLVGEDAGGIIAYRRGEAAPTAVAAVTLDLTAERPVAPRRKPTRSAARPSPSAPPPTPPGVTDDRDLVEIHRLLDAGETAAASQAIARLRGSGQESARLLFLDAMRALALDDRGGAERALRGALYLDGGFAMAHYLLAQSFIAAGRTGAARRALINAVNALAAAPSDDVVAESDGRTVADLRKAVEARLSAIGAA